MPRIPNSPNPENEELRPTRMDNYADNKLNKGRGKKPIVGGQPYVQKTTKPSQHD